MWYLILFSVVLILFLMVEGIIRLFKFFWGFFDINIFILFILVVLLEELLVGVCLGKLLEFVVFIFFVFVFVFFCFFYFVGIS